MVDNEFLGALRSAMARGETLKQAMISLHNAGYDKPKIETSAKALLKSQQPIQKVIRQTQPANARYPKYAPKKPIQQQTPKGTIQKVSQYGTRPTKKQISSQVKKLTLPKQIQKVSSYGKPLAKKQILKPAPEPVSPRPAQKVSSYGQQPTKPEGKLIIILLVLILLLLSGILVSVFFFKEGLVDFVNKLFN